MDVAALIPIADALPVPWFPLLALLTGTTFLHLVAMNVMFGTGAIALAAPLMMGEAARPMVRTVAGTMVYSTALTVNMGVAPLLFLQALYGQFFYTSTVLMAVYWLSIVILLIVTYYSIYIYKLKYSEGGGGLVFLAIPVVIMLIVSFLFCSNISLMQMPESWARYFENRGGWLLNFGDAALVPRYLHFVLSAAAVGGLAVAVLFEWGKKRGGENGERWIQHGCDWFVKATIANFGVGFWFLGSLPGEVVGSNAPMRQLFILSIMVSVGTIIPALISAHRMQVYRAAGWTLATVLLMTVAREIARISYLKPYLNLPDLPVNPQYSPFVVFLVAAAAVSWLLWWMFAKVRLEMEVK